MLYRFAALAPGPLKCPPPNPTLPEKLIVPLRFFLQTNPSLPFFSYVRSNKERSTRAMHRTK